MRKMVVFRTTVPICCQLVLQHNGGMPARKLHKCLGSALHAQHKIIATTQAHTRVGRHWGWWHNCMTMPTLGGRQCRTIVQLWMGFWPTFIHWVGDRHSIALPPIELMAMSYIVHGISWHIINMYDIATNWNDGNVIHCPWDQLTYQKNVWHCH